MALVVFIRGINVGGHRRIRPSILAEELSHYDVVNVGGAGTFVVRKPHSRIKFREELLKKLPFEAEVMLCEGRELTSVVEENPFGNKTLPVGVVRFVSIFAKPVRRMAAFPLVIPPDRDWFVKLLASKRRFVFGMYRRNMKTIGYLGQIDKLFGVSATTRNWNTILAIVRILKG